MGGEQRYYNFIALGQHAWLAKIFAKLNLKERNYCYSFLKQTSALSKSKFEETVNRMFLDRPELREELPHWKEMTELLTCANSALKE